MELEQTKEPKVIKKDGQEGKAELEKYSSNKSLSVSSIEEGPTQPQVAIHIEGDSASENEVFVSVKSISISGSNPELRGLVTDEGIQQSGAGSCIGVGSGITTAGNNGNKDNLGVGVDAGGGNSFTIPDIKSETRVLVPRVCSDSHIGEGEGFHSSRLSSSASHGSLSSALLAIGILSASGSNSKNPLVSVEDDSSITITDKQDDIKPNILKCETGNDNELVVEDNLLQRKDSDEDSRRESGESNKKKARVDDVFLDSVKTDTEDIEDADYSIQAEHDLSVANTEDFLDDEELLDEYDEPDDELHLELEKIFDTELLLAGEDSDSNRGAVGRRSHHRRSPKASKFRDTATWTQEDDMPSPLSDLSPVQSPRKSGRNNRSGILGSGVGGNGTGGLSGHQPQFDHQYQYQHQQYYRDRENLGNRHHHQHHGSSGGGGGSRNSRSHHRSSRGIHQSQSNQRSSGIGGNSSSVGEFIHHQPQQHHQPTECFTVSSQLLSREARLYENVPTTQGELETLEILLAGESCNYPTSGGSAGASNTSKASTSNASQTNKTTTTNSSINSNKNNGSSGGGGSSSGSNHNNHNLLHHHHSATNLNLGGPSSSGGNSVEQLFSVSELLGPGSCLAVGSGGGCGPPSRTSWVDSGRESLSFDGENNNSGGSSRNLLLIPPPPPPPINYQGFGTNNIIMHKQHQQYHHQSSQSPSHTSGHHHSSRKSGSRRDRLVRQKQAIDEPFLPIPTNSDKLGIEHGGGYLAIPSPRRGVIPGNMIASNFTTAAASPISLQRHPPPSQIMLQENKKNRPLIPCDSPYGIMSGGLGNGTGDWGYGASTSNGTDKKGSLLTRDLLRCRSPQRGRSRGKGHNQSFDYGELPSHQMFPKRHLLTSRQLSSHHQQQQHQGYPTGTSLASGTAGVGGNNVSNGSNSNGNNINGNSPFLLHPHQNHRSFPAGLFSGMTPKSCSMGDLTSSAASPNGHSSNGHHNYPSYHGNGKAPDQIALCSNTNPSGGGGGGMQSSTVPLVTSLPLPPATSVTYEFSLAPQSGTLAPGWHLTAVQRGLATAVPLAAAVARRRLPRPRTTRPRFGFTDKNEARRAKWTIVITALALLAMSMLLVGITLRLAPLIDDLGFSTTHRHCIGVFNITRRDSTNGTNTTNENENLFESNTKSLYNNLKGSSSTSTSLSPTKSGHMALDPYARRASGSGGCSSFIRSSAYINGNSMNGSGVCTGSCRELLPPASASPILDSSKGSRRSYGDTDIKRQISATLSIPSRQDSCKSSSSKSTLNSGQASPIITKSRIPKTTVIQQPLFRTMSGGNENEICSGQYGHPQLSRATPTRISNKNLQVLTLNSPSARTSRCNSIALSMAGVPHQAINELRPSDKRNRRYVIFGFGFLLFIAIACVVISLGMGASSVRKENESIMRVIQQTTSMSNLTHGNNNNKSQVSSTLSPLPPIIEDQDESNNNYMSNSNSNVNSNSNLNNNKINNKINPSSGQSLSRKVITVDPGPEETEGIGNGEIDKAVTPTAPGKDKPISSSLIGEILLKNLASNNDEKARKIRLDQQRINGFHEDGDDDFEIENDKQASNSPTQFKSENSNIFLGQMSDIDEIDRGRTSIVLR